MSSLLPRYLCKNPIPASFLRGGTSKGIFLLRQDLPPDRAAWAPVFLGLMGSPDPLHGRQLNGMGGGVSSLSKVVVVEPASEEQQRSGISVAYTFAQVGVKDSSVDYSGNCGNLSAMVGVFARDHGLCASPLPGATHMTVRAWNVNTQKAIDTTFPVNDHGVAALDHPEVEMAGVPGKASTIVMEFVKPGGARTGKLLPSGSPSEDLVVSGPSGEDRILTASLVDATNPTVLVGSAELAHFIPIDDYLRGSAVPVVDEVLERIRQAGAERMGLDPSAQAQPKIAILSAPTEEELQAGVDIVVHALSMGVLHRAVPGTVGLCIGVAANVTGTLPWQIVQRARGEQAQREAMIRIKHPSGIVEIGAEFEQSGDVKSAKVIRTGRRLMEGRVWW